MADNKLDRGDTAWILTATALVLMMTLPGLALFRGGLVQAHNLLSVLMHCCVIAAFCSVLWLVAGCGIAFGDGGAANALWGSLNKMFLVAALLFGIAGGAVCFYAVALIKLRLKIDVSLHVFVVHGSAAFSAP